MKTAIVHDWLITYAGAERVLEEIIRLFPDADLYALLDFIPGDKRDFIQNKPVRTSFIQKFPFARKKYRSLLPFMPLAIEQFDMSDYDLVISSNFAVAKGVITGPDQLHICMCYSPMRYAWDLTHHYLHAAGMSTGIKGWLAKYCLHKIRIWDCRAANGVDEFIAISDYIAARIMKAYRRDSTVIYPPVDTDRFSLCTAKEDFYLTASRMVPYKKIDLIVEAFSMMPDKKLTVIGDGPDFKKVKSKAGPNVTLLRFQPHNNLKDYMQRARAFVFAAEEDFGIVPVEAQACGTPVIAYGKGGALETVENGLSGIFFYKQETDAIMDAVRRFENMEHQFNPNEIRENALKFSADRFRTQLTTYINKAIEKHSKIKDKSMKNVRRFRLLGKMESGEISETDDEKNKEVAEIESQKTSFE